MSHEPGSIPAPRDDERPTAFGAIRRVAASLRRHLSTWPRRYVEMRTGGR